LALAERFSWQARLPLVIVVCGLPASGKSHLGDALGAASGLPLLSSDLVRKRIGGVAPGERAPLDLYNEEWSRRTYGELGRLAASEVAARRGVLVDATFRRRGDRDAFAEAFGRAAPLLFVECWAPLEVRTERASRREAEPWRISDASASVVQRERDAWEPLEEVPPEADVTLRTDRPVREQLADLQALLDRRLGRLE
jgi:predicted kinase